jgi:hypothetical protein
VVQVMLSSRREIDTKTRSSFNNKTAAEQGRAMASAKKKEESEEDCQQRQANNLITADLIDAYEKDPVGVRKRLRCLPGIRAPYIGWMFALVVFFSDGFLHFPEQRDPKADHSDFKQLPNTLSPSEARRFFLICSKLPLDLQMVICNRMFGSAKDVILSRDSEAGFKWVVKAGG